MGVGTEVRFRLSVYGIGYRLSRSTRYYSRRSRDDILILSAFGIVYRSCRVENNDLSHPQNQRIASGKRGRLLSTYKTCGEYGHRLSTLDIEFTWREEGRERLCSVRHFAKPPLTRGCETTGKTYRCLRLERREEKGARIISTRVLI